MKPQCLISLKMFALPANSGGKKSQQGQENGTPFPTTAEKQMPSYALKPQMLFLTKVLQNSQTHRLLLRPEKGCFNLYKLRNPDLLTQQCVVILFLSSVFEKSSVALSFFKV